MKIKITLKRRSGKFLETLELPPDTPVAAFKSLFYEKFHYYPERQRWTIGEVSGEPLKDGTLAENKVHDGTTLYFKDLGVQISWRLVFVMEYFGPIGIFPLFYYFPGIFYGVAKPERCLVQNVALCLAIFHYGKRELETLFVHRFSNVTMPIIRVPLNCGHYWVLFGLFVGYFLFHPRYMPPFTDDQQLIIYSLAASMVVFELFNFKTHLILRNLRPRGTKERGIPQGWGFGVASCANYTWETLSWIVFSILVQTATSWLFTIVAFLQMAQWALKKHSMYKKQFDQYPRRKAIIPFIL